MTESMISTSETSSKKIPKKVQVSKKVKYYSRRQLYGHSPTTRLECLTSPDVFIYPPPVVNFLFLLTFHSKIERFFVKCYVFIPFYNVIFLTHVR